MIDKYNKFVANEKIRRWVVLAFIVVLLYLAKSMLSLILLTFVFSYLANRFVSLIERKINLPGKITGVILYSLIVFLIYFAATHYLPALVKEMTSLVKAITKFYKTESTSDNPVVMTVYNFLKEYNFADKIQSGLIHVVDYLTSFGKGVVTVLFAFLMSFFFVIDKKESSRFSKLFLKGDIPWFFEDIYYLGRKFVHSFGVVIETQFIIAIVNTTLTVITLSIFKFPELLSLGVMIFLLSLIPVAGVIVSCIPLSIIGYSIGGIKDVILILLMIALIHALESYVLNPHLMAHKTKLPMFYTFVILFLGEHLFGVWGLLFGVPLFNFILDMLKVQEIMPETQKHGKAGEKLVK